MFKEEPNTHIYIHLYTYYEIEQTFLIEIYYNQISNFNPTVFEKAKKMKIKEK